VYATGLHTAAPAPAAARALLRYLTTPEARRVVVKAGLEPGG